MGEDVDVGVVCVCMRFVRKNEVDFVSTVAGISRTHLHVDAVRSNLLEVCIVQMRRSMCVLICFQAS